MGGNDGRNPVCTIIGGPNGSGKSTIYKRLTLSGRFINADVIAREINPSQPEAASLAAGRQTLAELARLLAAREDFSYETTLSSHQSIGLMRDAKAAGYEVGLVFVALNSPDLNVLRVAHRVTLGGHDIPESVVRRRYDAALKRLPEAMCIANETLVFDNSMPSGPSLLLSSKAGSIEVNALVETDNLHRRLATVVSEALGMPVDTVFRVAKSGSIER